MPEALEGLGRVSDALNYVIYTLSMLGFFVVFFHGACAIRKERAASKGGVVMPLRRALPALALLLMASLGATAFQPRSLDPGGEVTFYRALECLVAGVVLGTLAGRMNLKVVGEEDWSAWMLCERHMTHRRAWKVPAVKLWVLHGFADRAGGAAGGEHDLGREGGPTG